MPEYLPHSTKSFKELLENAELNGDAEVIAKNWLPDNERGQYLVKLEILGKITEEQREELKKIEQEEQKKSEKDTKNNLEDSGDDGK